MAVLTNFQNIEVIPLSRMPAKILVRWQVNLQGADLADYQFFVERGDASESAPGFQEKTLYNTPVLPGPSYSRTLNFRVVSRAIDGLDNLFYVDYTPEMLNLQKPLSYRVRARRKSTQEEITSYATGLGGGLDLVGLYVAEETNFELWDTTGAPSLVYNRKRGGVQCPKCFDPIQKKRTSSHCTTCFGTNWVGGFFNPIDAYIDYNPNPKLTQITQFGETQENFTRVKLANFPIIYPGDVIRELRPNRLWRVGPKVDVTEKHRVTLIQFPQIQEIKPGDVEYQIPIDEAFMLAKIEEFEATRKRREF